MDIVLDARYPSTDWQLMSRESARHVPLPDGLCVSVPSPPFYLACKIAASRNPKRWEGTY